MSIFASEYAQDGIATTDRAYRKVELQSSADLTYLIAKLSRTAREKIDKHFPPGAVPGEDQMKAQVEMLVDEYIRQTYSLAKPNLSINGMDTCDLDMELAKTHEAEEYEPFDTKLAYQMQDLSRDIEEHTLQLAELRRDAPAVTASTYFASLQDGEEKLKSRMQQEPETQGVTITTVIPRLEDIRQNLAESKEQIAGLRSSMDSTVLRATKAKQAQEYISR